MEYREAIRALYARMPSRIGPTLERIAHLVDLLDHPERTAPAIHLTGTNGKTTSARMITTLLAAFGVAAGRYTSPHLQDVRERIALPTRVISKEELAETWTYLEPFLAEVDREHDQPVTFHEALTALAFTWFSEVPVDAQVIEVGMGGSWDATNVVDGQVAVINRVGLHQADNAAGALAAVETFLGGRPLDADTVRAGFAGVTSPGRLEVIGHDPLVVLDGAHNPDGARMLAAALLEEFVVDRRTMVVACLRDKDVRGILAGLAPAVGRLIVTTNSSPRAASAEQLAKEAEAVGLVP